MKRNILLAFLIAIVVIGIYSVKEWMPIMAIAGNSMEPELKQGDVILIEKILPSEIKEGDVIVFKVHPLIQESYRYPAIVAHRVIELTTFKSGLAFKTQGDNTAEDPFVVPTSDLRGKVKDKVPYVGYLLLYLQSRQGMIFTVVALGFLSLYLYASDISRTGQRLRRGVFGPILEQNQELAQRQEEAMQMSSEVLEQFATAMNEYAQHLQSHTGAIQGLSEASQELKTGAAEQNKVLNRLMKIIEQTTLKKEEITPKEEQVISLS